MLICALKKSIHDNTEGIQLAQDMVKYRDTVINPKGSTRSGELY
jgi:hypothetical protein